MLKNIKTFWITCIILLALTLVNVANCAPLVSLQDSNSTHSLSEHKADIENHISTDHCSEIEEHTDLEAPNHCCSSNCLLSLPIVFTSKNNLNQPYTLALIPLEPAVNADAFSNALYKPPIT